ncbi:hypothetical protein [Microtetraspora sp. NBRC 13810]|uniref:hypothetical protein n=1 Tax=Microtetraspora sp. NBRC 13810 TaxID=3030990 RepID=UPI0025547A8A|nr:hypothetical protein [Microtetraspora sp. NBRC 13810]
MPARGRLAEAQRELLAALVAGGPRPEGFDEVRLRIQSASLIAKRRGLVARFAPELTRRLGSDFAPLFTSYAQGHPKPPGGSRADARAFIEWLDRCRSPERRHTTGPVPPPERISRWRRFFR